MQDPSGEREAMLGSGSYAYATPDSPPHSPYSTLAASVCPLSQSDVFKQVSPYWQPSDEEDKLMLELRKLNMRFFVEQELQ